MALSMTNMHSPPIAAWTPYQMLKAGLAILFKQKRKTEIPCHYPTVKCAPQTAIQAETCTSNDRKSDVIYSSRTRIENDKRGYNAVAEPDTDPRLPPRELGLDHCRCDHPTAFGIHDQKALVDVKQEYRRVDIEAVRDPTIIYVWETQGLKKG